MPTIAEVRKKYVMSNGKNICEAAGGVPMTPLAITMAIHFHCIADFWPLPSPAADDVVRDFIKSELITTFDTNVMQPGQFSLYRWYRFQGERQAATVGIRSTDKLRRYILALQAVDPEKYMFHPDVAISGTTDSARTVEWLLQHRGEDCEELKRRQASSFVEDIRQSPPMLRSEKLRTIRDELGSLLCNRMRLSTNEASFFIAMLEKIVEAKLDVKETGD